MGLAELAWEIQGKRIEQQKGGRILILDITNLEAMSRRLKRVRDDMALLKKEDDRLKTAILTHPKCKIGYQDDGIKVTEELTPDTDDPKLLEILRRKGYWERVTSTSISTPALRAVATEDPEVAAAITWLSSRKINKRRG